MKAVVLFSSGLDSLITLHLLRSFGIDVAALNIVTPFHDVSEAAKRRAEMYGFPCYVRQTGEEYVPLVMKPRWGYGTAVNPCIDCRIRMCRMAGELMREIGADFAATGEITGQRPNSQKQHQLLLIDRESGLSGYLLRPLSARVLPPTEVEKRGFIDREKLLGFSGRGRGHLIRLAQSFGVKEIPQPASGCLLCEKTFAPRILDTMKHIPEPTCWDFRILRFGRLLRINESLRCVIARDVKDCRNLARLFEQEDRSASVFLEPENFNGPALLMVGAAAQEHAALAGALVLRFSNPEKTGRHPAVRFRSGQKGPILTDQIMPVFPSPDADAFPIL